LLKEVEIMAIEVIYQSFCQMTSQNCHRARIKTAVVSTFLNNFKYQVLGYDYSVI